MFVINKEQCACCHNCACECPRQAIDYVGTKYEIDQSKCVQCGLCARVCHTGACHEEPVNPDLIQRHPPLTLECDIVVIGSGSGMVAAIRAAQRGKKVLVLEKAAKTGGNTDFAHGYFPVYTQWHKEAGMPDLREQAIQHYLEATDHELDPEVVRTAVYGCGEFFDWLCEFGTAHEVYRLVNLEDADAHGPIYGPGLLDFPTRRGSNLLCRDDAIGPGWGASYVKETMIDAITRQNLDVQILLSTAAKHLLLDEDGAVCGVQASDPGGELTIRCKAVMLACGGMGRSDEKLQKYFGFFDGDGVEPHRFSVPGDTGDGIDMLQELGVEPDEEHMFCSIFGIKHHPFNNVLADMALQPEVLQINLNGMRWVDESTELMGMTPRIKDQPKMIGYAIATREMYQQIADRFLQNPAFEMKKHFYATWEEELLEEAQLDTPVKVADTLEELAEKCGMPADALRATVQRYNEFCRSGVDEDFGKAKEYLIPVDMEQGPYYAIYEQRFSEAAFGGVRVNGNCQVTREDGSVIPGLYAGGDCTSAMHRRGKLAVISELTWAFAAAYVSGKNMVDYIEKLEG